MSIKTIAKRIQFDGETWKSALNRAKKIKKYAPKYEPELWNSDPNVQHPHNCYTYFLNKRSKRLTNKCKKTKCSARNSLKPQPGYYAGFPRIKNNRKYNCKNLTRRMLKDNKHMYKTKKQSCKKGYYLGALAVHPNLTYHYYRQDNDGFWSHKDGGTKAKRYDADGNMILDPAKANRYYPDKIIQGHPANYSDFCGYFCVPKNQKKKHWKSGPKTRKRRKRKKKLK